MHPAKTRFDLCEANIENVRPSICRSPATDPIGTQVLVVRGLKTVPTGASREWLANEHTRSLKWASCARYTFHRRVGTKRRDLRFQAISDCDHFHTATWHGIRHVGSAVRPLLAHSTGRQGPLSLDLVPSLGNRRVLERLDSLLALHIDKPQTGALSEIKVSQRVVHPPFTQVARP